MTLLNIQMMNFRQELLYLIQKQAKSVRLAAEEINRLNVDLTMQSIPSVSLVQRLNRFLIMALRLNIFNWGTYQMIEDKPIKYSTGKNFGNWDDSYIGAMTIRTALAIVTKYTGRSNLQQVGLDKGKKLC